MQPIFASCAKIAQTIFKTTLPNRNLRLFICNLFSMRFSTSRNRFYLQSVREISHCHRPGRYSRHILYPRTSRNTRHSFPQQYIDTLRLSLFVPGNFSRSPVFYGSRLYGRFFRFIFTGIAFERVDTAQRAFTSWVCSMISSSSN